MPHMASDSASSIADTSWSWLPIDSSLANHWRTPPNMPSTAGLVTLTFPAIPVRHRRHLPFSHRIAAVRVQCTLSLGRGSVSTLVPAASLVLTYQIAQGDCGTSFQLWRSEEHT